jgi:hypothetical protein
VSSAIKKALNNLDQAIDRIEGSVAKKAKAPRQAANGQPDLFTAPRTGPVANVVGFDRNALARKLDMTIAKVEQLLSEG